MTRKSPLQAYLDDWQESDAIDTVEDNGPTIRIQYAERGEVGLSHERARELLERFGYAVVSIASQEGVVLLGSVRVKRWAEFTKKAGR